jgi:hypothetical protein
LTLTLRLTWLLIITTHSHVDILSSGGKIEVLDIEYFTIPHIGRSAQYRSGPGLDEVISLTLNGTLDSGGFGVEENDSAKVGFFEGLCVNVHLFISTSSDGKKLSCYEQDE